MNGKNGYFIPIRKVPNEYMPKSKATKLEAYMFLQIDFTFRNKVSVLKYSQDWGWHRATIKKFITDNCVYIKSKKGQRGTLEQNADGLALGDKSPIVNMRITVQR